MLLNFASSILAGAAFAGALRLSDAAAKIEKKKKGAQETSTAVYVADLPRDSREAACSYPR